jgi:hypothetical protein
MTSVTLLFVMFIGFSEAAPEKKGGTNGALFVPGGQ